MSKKKKAEKKAKKALLKEQQRIAELQRKPYRYTAPLFISADDERSYVMGPKSGYSRLKTM